MPFKTFRPGSVSPPRRRAYFPSFASDRKRAAFARDFVAEIPAVPDTPGVALIAPFHHAYPPVLAARAWRASSPIAVQRAQWHGSARPMRPSASRSLATSAAGG